MLISASFASAESVIVATLAAVVLLFSVASMLSFVPSTLVPLSLMSTISVDPTGAVLTVARTAVSVAANGIRKRILFVPAVSAVVSSETLMMITSAAGVCHAVA